MAVNDITYGWDDSFENTATNYVLLPPGEYPFEVVKFERSNYDGSDKLPVCKMAILSIVVHGSDRQGDAFVTQRLFLCQSMQARNAEFFISIGQAQPDDEVIHPKWDQIDGSSGRCRLEVHSYTNQKGEERESNEIKKFLPPPAPTSASSEGGVPSWKTGAF